MFPCHPEIDQGEAWLLKSKAELKVRWVEIPKHKKRWGPCVATSKKNVWSNDPKSIKVVKFESSFDFGGVFAEKIIEIPSTYKRMTPQELIVKSEGGHRKVVQV